MAASTTTPLSIRPARSAASTNSGCATATERVAKAHGARPLVGLALLLVLAAGRDAAAGSAPATEVPGPAPSSAPAAGSGTARVEVDAREAPRGILRVHLLLPVSAGPLTLVYPKWLPGRHGPAGPITNLAGSTERRACEVGDGTSGAVSPRQPFRVHERQWAGAHRQEQVDSQDPARCLTRVDFHARGAGAGRGRRGGRGPPYLGGRCAAGRGVPPGGKHEQQRESDQRARTVGFRDALSSGSAARVRRSGRPRRPDRERGCS